MTPISVLVKYDRCRLTLYLPIFFQEQTLDKVRKVFKMIDERLWDIEDAVEKLNQFIPAWESELKYNLDQAKAELVTAKQEAETKRRTVAALGSTLEANIAKAKVWLGHAKRKKKKNTDEINELKATLERAMRPKVEHEQAVKAVKELERRIKAATAALEKCAKVINAYKTIKV